MKQLVKLSLAAILVSTTLASDETSANVASLTNTLLNKLEMPDNGPEWLKRTSFKFQVEQNFKPLWEIETVQPIYQFSDDDMMFWQLNANKREDTETYNFGLGYRNILNPELMLGINSFYDYQQDHKHKRWSIGLEALNPRFEFRANRYMAISGKKEVATNVYEEALDGWDIEIGGKLIPNNDLKTYISYTVWEGIQLNDLKQKEIYFEYPLNNTIDFKLGYTRDSEQQGDIKQGRVWAQVAISLNKKTKASKNLDTSENLHDKLLIPVKRENEIIVERTAASGGITIGRGN